jgi:hypothetical protein
MNVSHPALEHAPLAMDRLRPEWLKCISVACPWPGREYGNKARCAAPNGAAVAADGPLSASNVLRPSSAACETALI